MCECTCVSVHVWVWEERWSGRSYKATKSCKTRAPFRHFHMPRLAYLHVDEDSRKEGRGTSRWSFARRVNRNIQG